MSDMWFGMPITLHVAFHANFGAFAWLGKSDCYDSWSGARRISILVVVIEIVDSCKKRLLKSKFLKDLRYQKKTWFDIRGYQISWNEWAKRMKWEEVASG